MHQTAGTPAARGSPKHARAQRAEPGAHLLLILPGAPLNRCYGPAHEPVLPDRTLGNGDQQRGRAPAGSARVSDEEQFFQYHAGLTAVR